MSDTAADHDRDAAALALSDTGTYAQCEADHLTEPDAYCDDVASTTRHTPDGREYLIAVCAEHADLIDRARALSVAEDARWLAQRGA